MQRRFALDRRCPLAVVTPHVVVASPHYAHHVVVARGAVRLPHGYYHGANGHCLPY